MTTRAKYDRYVEFGSTLGNAIKKVDRVVNHTLDPLFRWGDAYWHACNRNGRRWPV